MLSPLTSDNKDKQSKTLHNEYSLEKETNKDALTQVHCNKSDLKEQLPTADQSKTSHKPDQKTQIITDEQKKETSNKSSGIMKLFFLWLKFKLPDLHHA